MASGVPVLLTKPAKSWGVAKLEAAATEMAELTNCLREISLVLDIDFILSLPLEQRHALSDIVMRAAKRLESHSQVTRSGGGGDYSARRENVYTIFKQSARAMRFAGDECAGRPGNHLNCAGRKADAGR